MADTRRTKSALQTILADNVAGDISAQDARDVLVSNHPEEACQQAAFASQPSTGQLTGDLFFPTDSCSVQRYDGSAWDPYGPLTAWTEPVDGDYSWVNQGSSTVTTTNGGIYLYTPGASGNSLRLRVKSAPSTPYTITAGFVPNMIMGTAAGPGFGLAFRQSSDGKLSTYRHYAHGSSGNRQWIGLSDKWSSATSYSAEYSSWNQGAICGGVGPCFIRIEDDGTDRKMYWSGDGINFILVHSIGRTDYLTADQVGFFVDSAVTAFNAGVLICSWKEA